MIQRSSLLFLQITVVNQNRILTNTGKKLIHNTNNNRSIALMLFTIAFNKNLPFMNINITA